MTFNGAMNSIPVLLLAIGVDYGLHVVKRIREEYRLASKSERGPVCKRPERSSKGCQFYAVLSTPQSHS